MNEKHPGIIKDILITTKGSIPSILALVEFHSQSSRVVRLDLHHLRRFVGIYNNHLSKWINKPVLYQSDVQGKEGGYRAWISPLKP